MQTLFTSSSNNSNIILDCFKKPNIIYLTLSSIYDKKVCSSGDSYKYGGHNSRFRFRFVSISTTRM